MATSSEASSNTRLEKFNGTDPSLYKRWKRRAQLMLIALPSTFSEEKLGPKLMEFLTGEAELAVEHIAVEELCKSGGAQRIFTALDERYGPLAKDEMAEALKEYFFDVSIRPGEVAKNFVTRLGTSSRKLEEQGVKLPPELKGWFLIRKLRLDPSQEAMVLTATAGSYKIEAVSQAVRSVLPNVRGPHKAKETLVVENAPSDDMDDQEVLETLVADMQEREDYSEEDMLEVYETYRQVRPRMQEVKKGRGFRGPGTRARDSRVTAPWKLRGQISAKLGQVKTKTRCHKCGQLGHWKRECPKGHGSNLHGKPSGGPHRRGR